MRGIEPPYSAWEADVLPLNYIRERADEDSGADLAHSRSAGGSVANLWPVTSPTAPATSHAEPAR